MRRWLRLLPLAALTLGLTWSGARASGDTEPTRPAAAPEVRAPALPPVIADGEPASTSASASASEFAFTNLRRF